MWRISSSLRLTPKPGMPVMRMPFLMTQNSSASDACCTGEASISGGVGFMPSWNSAASTPGRRAGQAVLAVMRQTEGHRIRVLRHGVRDLLRPSRDRFFEHPGRELVGEVGGSVGRHVPAGGKDEAADGKADEYRDDDSSEELHACLLPANLIRRGVGRDLARAECG